MNEEQGGRKVISLWGTLGGWFRSRARGGRDLVKEMEDLIEAGTAEGVLNEEEEEMLLSVLSFRKTLVREVMVPRTAMTCVEVAEPLETLVRVMVEEGHSRIPIYEETPDRILGFVTARDVLHYWGARDALPPLGEILRPAYFIPETMNLEALLGELKKRRLHLAIAVDEYGGVSGLVTLEDVLEEIVGEIQDEYDEEETDIQEVGDVLRVDARTTIEKLEEHLGVELGYDGEYETVGGLVFFVLGHVPVPGETFRYKGLEITVQDADKRRVKEVKIRTLARREPHGEPKDSPPPS
ncbi:MAG: hemolysin family protein [Deferrisomatales bacterium]